MLCLNHKHGYYNTVIYQHLSGGIATPIVLITAVLLTEDAVQSPGVLSIAAGKVWQGSSVCGAELAHFRMDQKVER